MRESWKGEPRDLAGASVEGITASAGEQDRCVEMSPYLQLPGRLELFGNRISSGARRHGDIQWVLTVIDTIMETSNAVGESC